MLSIKEEIRDLFKQQYKDAPLDAAPFHRLYKACDLKDCRGGCCSYGVSVEKPEVPAIKKVVEDHREFFVKNGIRMDVPHIRWNEEEETDETNVVPFAYNPGEVPDGFDHTSCVFKHDSGACSLQMLGFEKKVDSWTYKPTWCWLFPVSLMDEQGNIGITICPSTLDIAEDDGTYCYTSETKCGRTCSNGKPGYEIFAREIAMLSDIMERDLMSEIMAYQPKAA